MLFGGFLLGICLGWLAERVRRKPPRSLAQRRNHNISNALITAALIAAGAFYFQFVQSREPPEDVLQAMLFDIPLSYAAAAAFAGGFFLFYFRGWLRRLLKPFGIQIGKSGKKDGFDPLSLLKDSAASIVIGLLVLAILLYFAPDLRQRVQSINILGIETRFATLTQNSLRTMFGEGFMRNDRILFAGTGELSTVVQEMMENAQEQLIEHLAILPLPADASRERSHHFKLFHDASLKPLSASIEAYLDRYRTASADVRKMLEETASAWRRLSFSAVQQAPADDELGTAIVRVNEETLKLIQHMEYEIREGCGQNSECLKNSNARVAAYSFGPSSQAIPELFANGFSAVFIASLVVATSGYDEAVEYFTEIKPHLIRDPAEPMHEIYFHLRLAEAKFYARWHPRDSLSDRQQAGKLTGQLSAALSVTPALALKFVPTLSHYSRIQAHNLEGNIFELVRDWHEGRRLAKHELEMLAEASRELEKWLKENAHRASEKDSPYPWAIAGFHDALAIMEIALGDIGKDHTRSRCGVISAHLTRARDIYTAERAKAEIRHYKEFRHAFRTVDAHSQMYDAVCMKN